MSHEIRTPLSTVTMGIQLLKRSLNTGGGNVDINALNDIVSDLEGSCETAIEILNELLDYEKLEAGIMTIDKTRIMMKVLLDKNIRPFHLHANEKNIDLRVNYDVESDFDMRQAYVMGDQYKLSQVVRNLMSNGLKFTNHGGVVTVTIGVIVVGCSSSTGSSNSNSNRPLSDDPSLSYRLRFSVEDNGPGISKVSISIYCIVYLLIYTCIHVSVYIILYILNGDDFCCIMSCLMMLCYVMSPGEPMSSVQSDHPIQSW